ncbi:DUF1592 domain-containing protein [Alienimonas californiensis]|uniref:Planctomycete cytochrome C n=1 Tax=Alienimonas californiensis TaxID=2527989 RepID=A0A517PA53_9PLAN|nr:DUF1592 domain-containing protein [Alienimonas californiensis]QDT16244.1 hypothetical protein CA12_23440 [Alienimonas californiensis]
MSSSALSSAVLAALLLSSAAPGDDPHAGPSAGPTGAALSENGRVAAFLTAHCRDCHIGEAAEAGFDLDSLPADLSDPRAGAAWAKALGRIERGEMPPADYGVPPADESAAAAQALRAALTAAEQTRYAAHGRAELRRLSRDEYANALREALALPHLELTEMLPPDGNEHGFAKSAGALDFSHVTVSQYLDVADYALREALADLPGPRPPRTVRVSMNSVEGAAEITTLRTQLHHSVAIPLVGQEIDPTLELSRGDFNDNEDRGYLRDPEPKFDGVATFMHSRANHQIVVKPFRVLQDGEYVFRVRGWSLRNDHGTLKPTDKPGVVAFYTPSGRLLGRCDLPANEPGVGECRAWLRKDEPVEYLAVTPPSAWVKGRPVGDDRKWKHIDSVGVAIQWLEMEGPLPADDDARRADWPRESHRRLLGDLPLEPVQDEDAPQRRRGRPVQPVDPETGLRYTVVSENPDADAERLLRTFAERALRRPPTDADLATPLAQIRARLADDQPLVEALLAGYRALLTSPAFLLRLEEPGPLGGYELASRLSLFLWDGPPDDELKAAAARGELRTDAGLRRQTERLLNDAKADRFVAQFLDRWLALDEIRLTEPDENLYPESTDFLTESMVEETRAFFAAMLADDLPVSHVYDSDFLTINQPLAALYGVEGVEGSAIRRAPIPADHIRGGLLTQASLLKVTANGTTTSPVVRGVFVMDRLLGDPPPPPPASVPAIEPDISGATTIREQLEAHRADPACAGCHRKIDPPGFALESFDVMGAFRERYRVLSDEKPGRRPKRPDGRPIGWMEGPPVESSGDLPGAGAFADVTEFRERLRGMDRQIASNLLRRLTVYATGAPVSFADEAEFEAALDSLRPDGYGLRSMVHAVVQSELFRNK